MDDLKTFTLPISDSRNLRFTGSELAFVSSSGNPHSPGRHTELNLYKTKAGKYVCHRANITCWDGEADYFEGTVCETLDDVISFFDHGRLAKELYSIAKIDDVEVIA